MPRTHRLGRAVGVAAAAVLIIGAAACTSASGESSTPSISIASPTVTTSPSGVLPTESGMPSPSGQTTTYSSHGVRFDYPADWQQLKLTGTAASAGNQLWNVTVGADETNFVTVARYKINTSIDAGNIQQQMQGIASQLTGLFQQAGGSLTSGPTPQTMGGLPALGFEGTATNPSGIAVTSHLVLAFDGTTEYFVNCQYDEQGAGQIQPGCDTVVNSFQVTG